MGSVNAKPVDTRISRSHKSIIPAGLNYSALFSVISSFRSGLITLALTSAALPFVIIFYSPFPPSLPFFLFDAIPRLWKYSSDQLFTPRNLFLLLNFIILSIFAMAHLHPAQPAAAAVRDNNSPPQQHPAHNNHMHEISEEAAVRHSVSTEIAWNDQTSPYLSEMESTDLNIDDQDRRHSTDHKDDDIGDNQAISTGRLVLKEVVRGINLQLLAVDDYKHQYRADDHHVECQLKRKADKESKKAEKAKLRQEGAVGQCGGQPIGAAQEAAESKKAENAKSKSTQGTEVREGDNIDILLREEGSIFTRVQSRPLPSARFTHKKISTNKLQSGVDRPRSPMKLSRPVLKRGDTLEATWKAICESKRHSSPLTRHGHYSSWKRDSSGEMLGEIIMHSLNKHAELARAASPLTRRETTMAQVEELNAKVESFISRFNERIRIQREKSLTDYMEMVGRGAN